MITLTKPNGEIEDSYPAVIVPQNFTYGRQTDGSPVFVFFFRNQHREHLTTLL
ncbi:hypothetical protein H9X57_14705 [Flavobacterium piscinae]|nr:hypothetical protein [Flavobacterium piscinae]